MDQRTSGPNILTDKNDAAPALIGVVCGLCAALFWALGFVATRQLRATGQAVGSALPGTGGTSSTAATVREDADIVGNQFVLTYLKDAKTQVKLHAIDGKFGYLALYGAGEDASSVLAALGNEPLEIDAMGIDIDQHTGQIGRIDLDRSHFVPGQEFAHHDRDEAAMAMVVRALHRRLKRLSRRADAMGRALHAEGAELGL